MVKENSIEYYYSKHRYINFLKETRMDREIYLSKEAFLSAILSLISTGLIYFLIFYFKVSNISNELTVLSGIIIGSLIGLLGFIIGGLALIVGTIGNDLIKSANGDNKFGYLLSIIFRFYFVGSVLGLSILIHLFTFLILLIPLAFNLIMTLTMTFLASYFFFYSLFSSIMLLGSCIRLMILNYKYSSSKLNN